MIARCLIKRGGKSGLVLIPDRKFTASLSDIFLPNHSRTHYVYTDGACRNNGRENARASYGVHFSPSMNKKDISQAVCTTKKQTNNVGEVMAMIEAFPHIKEVLEVHPHDHVILVSDSKYAIGYASSTGDTQSKKNWKDDIPNKDLVKRLHSCYRHEPRISLQHVKAHTNAEDQLSEGNRKADLLANQALDGLNK